MKNIFKVKSLVFVIFTLFLSSSLLFGNTKLDELIKKANSGDRIYQYELGLVYYNGDEIPQDFKKAIYYYELSAKQGLANAQVNLGVMYAKGEGVPQDIIKAYAYFSVAASQGVKQGKENRDIALKLMTSSQIEKGQELAKKFYDELPK